MKQRKFGEPLFGSETDGDILMIDYLFIIGPSAVGKTTLAKGLHNLLGGVYLEQSMVPDFAVPPGTADEGDYEESLCWENVLLQTDFFHKKGLAPVIVLDMDDYRAREIPQRFKGESFFIFRLYSSDGEQLLRQMEYRKNHEGGLDDPELARLGNEKIGRRALLPNEIPIDIAGKSPDRVLSEVMHAVTHYHPLTDYEYEPDDVEKYVSWVKSRGLLNN